MKVTLCRAARALALAVAIGGMPATGLAAPDEIVVFTDDFEKKGEVGYELHLNYAARSRKTPDYPGEQAPHRVFRVMPEVVWGLSDKWNLGVHVPMSYDFKTRSATVDGLKLRLHNLNVIEHGKDSTTLLRRQLRNRHLPQAHHRIALQRRAARHPRPQKRRLEVHHQSHIDPSPEQKPQRPPGGAGSVWPNYARIRRRFRRRRRALFVVWSAVAAHLRLAGRANHVSGDGYQDQKALRNPLGRGPRLDRPDR